MSRQRFGAVVGVLVILVALAAAWFFGQQTVVLPDDSAPDLEWKQIGELPVWSARDGIWTGDRFLVVGSDGREARLYSSADGAAWEEVDVAMMLDDTTAERTWSDGSTTFMWAGATLLRSDDGGQTFNPVDGLDIVAPADNPRGVGTVVSGALVEGDTAYVATTTEVDFSVFLTAVRLPGVDEAQVQSLGADPGGLMACIVESEDAETAGAECQDRIIPYADLNLGPDEIEIVRAFPTGGLNKILASVDGGPFRVLSEATGYPTGPLFLHRSQVVAPREDGLWRGTTTGVWSRQPLPELRTDVDPTPGGALIAVGPEQLFQSADGTSWEPVVDIDGVFWTSHGPGGAVTAFTPAATGAEALLAAERTMIVGWTPNGSDWAWQSVDDLPLDQALRDQLGDLFQPMLFVVGDDTVIAIPDGSGSLSSVPVLRAPLPSDDG